MSKKRAAGQVEWVGGIDSVPAYVDGEGEAYRPELLIWMSAADGMVIGFETAAPGELLPQAGAHFLRTLKQPMYGPTPRPTRVRVATRELADSLRPALPLGIEITCGPTPELTEVMRLMRERMDADLEEPIPSYLSPAFGTEQVAALFRAAAGLFRAAPWKTLALEQSLLLVTSPELDLWEAALSVIGHGGESFGLLMFPGLRDFAAFVAAGEEMDDGGEPELPPHLALSFVPKRELHPALLEEIGEHGWAVAGPRAYPLLVMFDPDGGPSPLTAEAVRRLEAIALALPAALDNREFRAGIEGEDDCQVNLEVRGFQGPIKLTLRSGFDVAGDLSQLTTVQLVDALAELTIGGAELDDDARLELEDALMSRFVAAPEGAGLEDLAGCEWIMEFAANHHGVTIATLDARQLDEVVFEIIPRKVAIEASEAGGIIRAARALFSFLKREAALEQADACLRILGQGAEKRLQRALSDPSNFGIGKSILAAGREAGFAIDTQSGIEAWMREVQGRPLPQWGPTGAPSKPRPDPKTKDKRKAERKARKKNRRP